MQRYVVKRREIWIQEVEVEAPTAASAIDQVAKGYGEIRTDAQFEENDTSEPWAVEEVTD